MIFGWVLDEVIFVEFGEVKLVLLNKYFGNVGIVSGKQQNLINTHLLTLITICYMWLLVDCTNSNIGFKISFFLQLQYSWSAMLCHSWKTQIQTAAGHPVHRRLWIGVNNAGQMINYCCNFKLYFEMRVKIYIRLRLSSFN